MLYFWVEKDEMAVNILSLNGVKYTNPNNPNDNITFLSDFYQNVLDIANIYQMPLNRKNIKEEMGEITEEEEENEKLLPASL